jgi:hypothetical protein
VSRKIPEFPYRPGRDEAGAQEAVLKELRNPFAVLGIGLSAGNLLNVLGVDQQDLEAPFEEVLDGFPEDPRGLHGHVSHLPLSQPIAKGQQISGHRPELPHLLSALPSKDADHDRLLVDVQTGTRRIHQIQLIPPGARSANHHTTAPGGHQ